MNTFKYGRQEARLVSGIALLLMLMHHFWGFPNWLAPGNELLSVFPFSLEGKMVERGLSSFGKLCVAIFAFNSGYVLYVNRTSYTWKNIFRRIVRFLVSYWLVCLFFLVCGFLLHDTLPPVGQCLLNLLGIDCAPMQYVSVPFAWYVNFYVLFMLLSPCIVYCTRGRHLFVDLLLVLFWLLLYQEKSVFVLSPVLEINVNNFFLYGFVSLFAYFVAKYRMFDLLRRYLGENILVHGLLLLGIIGVRLLTVHRWGCELDFIYATLFIYVVTTLCSRMPGPSVGYRGLLSIGALSMNMWFLHGIFFTGENRLQWLLYLPKYSFLILLWGGVMTYVMAVVFARIQDFVLQKVGLKH